MAEDPEIAWFFASLAPGNHGRGYSVIEIELPDAAFVALHRNRLVHAEEIVNVPFRAVQYRFDVDAFDMLNELAIFRP